jgi:hypothetical protein
MMAKSSFLFLATSFLIHAISSQHILPDESDTGFDIFQHHGLNQDTINRPENSFLMRQRLDTSNQRQTFDLKGLYTYADSSVASCKSFSTILTTPELVSSSTCGNAVPYSFYVPAGYTLGDLETMARSYLNIPVLSLLPNACQVAYKKLICSNVYMKCAPNADPADGTETNWNAQIYSDGSLDLKVPFQRPCKNLCSNANNKCLGLLSLLGLKQDCDASYDYSFGLNASKVVEYSPYQYDANNVGTVCNAMSSNFLIGKSFETYLGATTGQCAGIVDSLFVVPASRVSKALAPLLPPGVVQSAIELGLKTSFDKIPVFISQQCRFALKKYFCRSAMPKVVSQSFEDAFGTSGLASKFPLLEALGVNVTTLKKTLVYYPSLPSQEVCQTYATECADFITLANKSSLLPDCLGNATFSGIKVKKYPSTRQTTLALPVTVTTPLGAATLAVNFKSDPDSVSTASILSASAYTTYCPEGFVAPDDPSDSRIRYITGTGCAVACRVPTFTEEEYAKEDAVMNLMAIIGIPFTFLVLVLYMMDEKRRQDGQTVILFAFFACINAISYTSLRATPSAEVCANNAVGLQSGDGESICTVTAFVNMYCVFACCVAWMLFSVDKFLKIVVGIKGNILREFNIIAVVLYPLIAVVGAAKLKLWGYSNGPKQCVFSGQNPRDFNLFAIFVIPILVLVVTAVASKFVVIIVVLFTRHRKDISTSSTSSKKLSAKVETNSSDQEVTKDESIGKAIRVDDDRKPGAINAAEALATANEQTSYNKHNELTEVLYDANDISYDHSIWDLIVAVVFNAIFLALWAIVIYFRISGYKYYYTYYDSFQDWAQCAFRNFEYPSQNWKDDCGTHPEKRPAYAIHFINFMFLGGQGLIFAVIFLSNPTLWH